MNPQEKNTYLIKRNPDLTDRGVIIRRNNSKKYFSEFTIRNKVPISDKLQIKDKIYVHETGYGIYAKAIVEKKGEVIKFTAVDQVLDFYSNVNKNSKFWLDHIIKFKKEIDVKGKAVLKYQEYQVDLELLERTIPLEGQLKKFKFTQSMVQIPDDKLMYIENNPVYENVITLKLNIPGSLKLDLHSLFNRKLQIEHWIDIDHFVPKSAYGPGNIIENLVPVGFGLNRYKGNSIPKGFFIIADKYSSLKSLRKFKYSVTEDEYYRSNKYPEAFSECQKINKYIRIHFTIEEAREFYREVIKHHFPQYVEIFGE